MVTGSNRLAFARALVATNLKATLALRGACVRASFASRPQ